MIPRRRKRGDDDAPAGAGWMVTFSDCMTLLLCFFVMLLTFSAFDENRLSHFFGSLKLMDHSSVFPPDEDLIRSVVPTSPHVVDRTPEGSDTPTDQFLKVLQSPQRSESLADTGAFRDRRVFYLPADELFWARGSGLTPSGREKLSLIAEMMKLIPSRVVVREIGDDGRARTDQAGLERSQAVVGFLAGKDVSRELLYISASGADAPSRAGLVEVSLLKGGMD